MCNNQWKSFPDERPPDNTLVLATDGEEYSLVYFGDRVKCPHYIGDKIEWHHIGEDGPEAYRWYAYIIAWMPIPPLIEHKKP
jgi:hypothetical protein